MRPSVTEPSPPDPPSLLPPLLPPLPLPLPVLPLLLLPLPLPLPLPDDEPLDDENIAPPPPLVVEPPQLAGKPVAMASTTRADVVRFTTTSP